MEEKSPFIVIFIVVIIAIVAIFIFFLPFFQTPAVQENIENTENTENIANNPIVVPVSYQYINGAHEYKGAIETSTPCYAISTNVKRKGSSTENIQIFFQTREISQSCVQHASSQTFFLSFVGPQNMDVDATLNGKRIQFEMTSVPANL